MGYTIAEDRVWNVLWLALYKRGFSKIEPNAKGSFTFDLHVGLLIITANQI